MGCMVSPVQWGGVGVVLVTMRNDLVMIDTYDVSVSCIAEIPAVYMHNLESNVMRNISKTLYRGTRSSIRT